MGRSIDELPTLTTPMDELQRAFPRILAEMATKHGPIFKRDFDPPLQNGITRLVYLVGPEANRLVLHTHREHFSNDKGWTPVLGPFFGRGLLNMDGSEWERHRKLMNPAFTAAYMARYLPVMAEVIRRRTADWIERGAVDLYVESREIAFDIAAAALFGLTSSDAVDRLRDGFYYQLHSRFDRKTETLQQLRDRMDRNDAELRSMLVPLVADRRESGRQRRCHGPLAERPRRDGPGHRRRAAARPLHHPARRWSRDHDDARGEAVAPAGDARRVPGSRTRRAGERSR